MGVETFGPCRQCGRTSVVPGSPTRIVCARCNPPTTTRKPTTFEEAVTLLRSLGPKASRTAALREGYEMRAAWDYGNGFFPVNTATGEVCEWKGRWTHEGDLLLCENCFEDGT